MSKSSENSNKGSSKEVSIADRKLKVAEEKKHKVDMHNATKGFITQVGSSPRASVVGRTSVTKMKNLKKKKITAEDSGSNTDEDYQTFLRTDDWHADVV